MTALTKLDITGTGITALDVSDVPGIASGKSYESYGKYFLYDESFADKVTSTKPKFYAKQLVLNESLKMPFYIELPENSAAAM